MTQVGQVPPGVDPTQPSIARVYDCLLGGENNFPVDRAAAQMMRTVAPELVDAASANRGFHQRAAKWLAEQGIDQFIDLGSGLPTVGNTHEVVRKVNRAARVVYVDNDPMVREHGSHLLAGDDKAAVLLADMRDPDAVMGSEAVARLIDLARPAAVLMTGVLHFVTDDQGPGGLVARYAAPLPAGSYISLSHMTADQKPPKAVETILATGRRSGGDARLRSRDEVREILGPLSIVPPYQGAEPEVTWVGLWNCEDPQAADSEGSRWLYCAVARKDS